MGDGADSFLSLLMFKVSALVSRKMPNLWDVGGKKNLSTPLPDAGAPAN